MEKERLILSDVDGVMLDWETQFTEYAIAKGCTPVPDTNHYYNLGKRFEESWDVLHDLMVEFNRSDVIANMPPLPGAVEGMKELTDLGFRFIAITSISDEPICKEYRTQNLHDLFGDVFDEIICLEQMNNKEHTLNRWADSGLFWLEDHFTNATVGYELGLNTLLFNTHTNEKYHTDLFPRTTQLNQWQDIVRRVKDEYKI